jgi:hypothetical protein
VALAEGAAATAAVDVARLGVAEGGAAAADVLVGTTVGCAGCSAYVTE